MVASLDGFIAKKDNSVAWFQTTDFYEKGVELTKQEMEDFLKTIDCYVMGANTYEHALKLSRSYGWAYGETPTIVVSQRNLPLEKQNVEIYSGNLQNLVHNMLKPKYKNIWVAGGAMLAKEFIRLNLANEIRLSVMPIILGDGLLFFDKIGQEQKLHLKNVTAYKSGIVELCYEIKNNGNI